MSIPSSYDTFVHLFAGAAGGTIGAIVTCPLEVVKTRLQSSVVNLTFTESASTRLCPTTSISSSASTTTTISPTNPRGGFFIIKFIRHIIETEGGRALWKGIGPNLVGVAPSRAIYFCTYSSMKSFCNETFKTPDTPPVHICSAATAGFVSCTATNPIWLVKTRLQLDQSQYGSTTAWSCIKDVYKKTGIIGFYKGITASYFGISETIIHFVIYEFIKTKLKEKRLAFQDQGLLHDAEAASGYHFIQYMAAGAFSKTVASVVTYPHEVARTRLRQEGDKYQKFFQTLFLVVREEGWMGMYRGLGMQLFRQIPNTAIMMATYELAVYMLKTYKTSNNSI